MIAVRSGLGLLYGQYGVALSLHNTPRRSGLVLDEYLATIFSLRDGRISAMTTYFSDVSVLNAFFA